MCSVLMEKGYMAGRSVFLALAEPLDRPAKKRYPNPYPYWIIGKAEHTVDHTALLAKPFRQIRTRRYNLSPKPEQALIHCIQ